MRRSPEHGPRTNLVRGVVLIVVAIAIGAFVLHRSTAVPASAVATQATTTTAPSSGAHPSTTVASGSQPPSSTSSTALRPPSQVTVLVANGTQTTGAAARVQSLLQKSGYDVLSATNSKIPASTSAVYYASGFSSEAVAAAELLGLAPSAVSAMPSSAPVANLRGADVLVLVGPNLASSPGS